MEYFECTPCGKNKIELFPVFCGKCGDGYESSFKECPHCDGQIASMFKKFGEIKKNDENYYHIVRNIIDRIDNYTKPKCPKCGEILKREK